jgi:hypothetical protein
MVLSKPVEERWGTHVLRVHKNTNKPTWYQHGTNMAPTMSGIAP